MTADEVVEILGLDPHPEGGFYRETYRHRPAGGGRGSGTAIYYLLRGAASGWHRVLDADEVWHLYAGAPVELRIARDGAVETLRLGPDLAAGERPQALIPAGVWQSAGSLGDWSLAGCTVSPAFEFESFELAPAGWSPPGA